MTSWAPIACCGSPTPRSRVGAGAQTWAVRDARDSRALGRGGGRAAVSGARVLDRPLAATARRTICWRMSGPARRRLCELRAGEGCGRWDRSAGLRRAARGRRALLVGGGVGIAPLAILQDSLAAEDVTSAVLLGFRDGSRARGRGAAERRARRHRRRLGRPPRPRHRPAGGRARAGRARGRVRVRTGADAGGRQGYVRRRASARPARAGGGHGVRVRRLLRLRRADARRRLSARVRRRPGDRRGRAGAGRGHAGAPA